jgi:probable phosphoglycerate mutase
MRHGEVDYFDEQGRPLHPDWVQLNHAGQQQARAAGSALADVRFDHAICSGLPRTEQTARLVLGEESSSLKIETEPRLREIEPGKLGDLGSVPAAMVREMMLGALSEQITPESRFLNGETFSSCAERALGAWRDVLARHDWNVLLIVAHGIVNRLVLTSLLGAPVISLGKLEQDAGCINLIDVDERAVPLVRLVNLTIGNPCKRGMRLSTLEGLYQQYLRGHRSRPKES